MPAFRGARQLLQSRRLLQTSPPSIGQDPFTTIAAITYGNTENYPALVNSAVVQGRVSIRVFSYFFVYTSEAPPLVLIDPSTTEPIEYCGSISCKCRDLSAAANAFNRDMTTFIFTSTTHYLTQPVVFIPSVVMLLSLTHACAVFSSNPQFVGYDCTSQTAPRPVVSCFGVATSSGGCLQFAFRGDQAAYLRGLVFSHASSSSSGGFATLSGFARIDECEFSECFSQTSGGALAIVLDELSTVVPMVVLSNCLFTGNSASVAGGALVSTGLSFTIVIDSTFSGNEAVNGGAFYSDSNIFSYRCTFDQNFASTSGGAIMLQQGLEGLFLDNVFTNNFAKKGGAAHFSGVPLSNMLRSRVADNEAILVGGGIFLEFSNLQGISVDLVNNRAEDGGAVYCLGDLGFSLTSSALNSNTAALRGGALTSIFCSPSFSHTELSNNSASWHGGAINLAMGSQFDGNDLIFRNNSATRENSWSYGGAVYSTASAFSISNSLFDSNSADFGGGCCSLGAGSVSDAYVISSCNFTSNEAKGGAGLFWNFEPYVNSSLRFSSNQAMYGPDQASGAASLRVLQTLPAGYSPASNAVWLYGVASGLFDRYGQLVTSDNTSTLTMEVPSDFVNTSLLGDTQASAMFGQHTFAPVQMLSTPNRNASFFFKAVDTNGHEFLTEELTVFIRQCISGEAQSLEGLRCDPCGAGKYSTEVGATVCTECAPGRFQDRIMSSACHPCPEGTATGDSGRAACSACLPGFYSPTTGLTQCHACTEGSYAPFEQLTACVDCEVGKFTSASNSVRCSYCQLEQFQNSTGASSCHTCPEHASSLTALDLHGEGWRNLSVDALSLTYLGCECRRGYFQLSDWNAPRCSNSPTDPYQPGAGINFIDVETNGPFCCGACPVGATCQNEDGITEDSIRSLEGWAPSVDGYTGLFFACFSDACCNPDDPLTPDCPDSGCYEGYTGKLCEVCDTGFTTGDPHICEKCPPPADNIVRLVFGFFGMLFYVAFSCYMTISGAKENTVADHSIYLKILTNAMQFNSLAASFNYDWPTVVIKMLQTSNSAGHVAESFVSFGCFVDNSGSVGLSSFFVECLAMAFFPFVLFALVIGFFRLRARCCKPGTCGANLLEMRRKKVALDNNEEYVPEVYDHLKYQRILDGERVTSLVVSMFLLQPTLMQYNFMLVSCYQVGTTKDTFYLLADMTFQCYTPAHYKWIVGLFAPMLMIWTLGIPLAAIAVLYPKRKLIMLTGKEAQCPERKAVDDSYSFLYAGYNPKYWFWEEINLLRKITLTFVAVFFTTDPQSQVLVAVIIILVSLCAQQYHRPFVVNPDEPDARRIDDMECFSLMTAGVTFVLGQFMFTLDGTGTVGVFLSMFIVVTNCMFYGTMIYRIVRAVWKNYKQEQEATMKMQKFEEMELVVAEKKEDCAPENKIPRALSSESNPESYLSKRASYALNRSPRRSLSKNRGYDGDVELATFNGFRSRLKHANNSFANEPEKTSPEVDQKEPNLLNELKRAGVSSDLVRQIALQISKPNNNVDSMAIKRTAGICVNELNAATSIEASKTTFVVSVAVFEAKKPNQLSFDIGDVIEVVKSDGRWPTGILRSSQSRTITGKTLYFPASLTKPMEVENSIDNFSVDVVLPSKKSLGVAVAAFTAKKPNQLSFEIGDTIEVVEAEGKWHRGILRHSSRYPTPSGVLYYPSKLINVKSSS